MKKWMPTISRLANVNALRLAWILVFLVSLVLGSGAPTAFGGGSSGAH